jgi:beta-lactamase class A
MIARRHITLGLGAGILAAPALPAAPSRAAAGLAASIADACRRIEADTRGRFGLAMVDTSDGGGASHRGGERFPVLSTFKMLACAALLKRVEEGREDLSRRIHYREADLVPHSPVTREHVRQGMTFAALCEATMTTSDNTAANLILAALDGPPGLTRFARSIGDPVTRLDRWETALNEGAAGDPRDTTTPEAMAGNLRNLVLGDALSPGPREQLTTWLLANRTGDGRLRAGLPRDWRIGCRTGTGDNGATAHIAVAWPPGRAPVIIAAYLTETTATMEARNAAFVQVARVVGRAVAG